MVTPHPCTYLRDPDPSREHHGHPVHACLVHDWCVTVGKHRQIAACSTCRERLDPADPKFAERWLDPLRVTGRDGRTPTHALRGLLAGRPAFLAGGGPSARELAAPLARRGVWTLAVNNCAGWLPAQAFVCSDPPEKFSHSIWLDPAVMKFVPIPKLKRNRGRLRRKVDGQFERLTMQIGRDADWWLSACDCPNVWGFDRRSWLRPDDSFFAEPDAAWGNHKSGVEMTGEHKTVCTLLLGLRLLHYLGCRRIYLIGVDFRMSQAAGYAFPQGRTEEACRSNNEQFATVNDWLCRMVAAGSFAKFGCEVYNCNPTSGLRAFAHVPFDAALADVVGQVEEQPDLQGWYEK